MTDFEIVPGTPTTYDVNVTVNSVVESEVTPGLTGIASRVAAVESRTVAGVPATAGDYPLAALIAAGLGGTDGDPITCPPGEMTDVVVVGGNIVNRKYVYAEIVEDGGSPPGLGLPPAHLHIGKVIVQTTEQYGSSGPLVEVIPPNPDRKPALDFTTWFRALDTTDFGAGDSVDFDLDGATVTATFTGVMDKSEIITALLTPLVTAGATNSGLVLSSPTEGGSISITDPGAVLDFSAVQAYGLGGYIRTIDNAGGGQDADAYFGPGTDNTDYELVGVGYGTHSSPTGANDIKRSAVVLSIPDPSVFLGARWTAVVWPDRSEFVPYSLENGGNNWYSNTHEGIDKVLDFQSDTAGTYTYQVDLADVGGVMVPTVTLVAPSGTTLSDSDPLGLSTADAGTGTSASRDDHVHPLPSLVTLGAVASADREVIIKPTTETLNTNTTLQDDDALTFAIAASEKWLVDILCFVYGPAGADLKVAVTVPASATMLFGVEGLPTSASSLPSAEQQIAVLDTSGTSTSVATFGGLSIVKLTGSVINSTNAGSVTLQWAQASSSGTNTEVRAGSRLAAQKM